MGREIISIQAGQAGNQSMYIPGHANNSRAAGEWSAALTRHKMEMLHIECDSANDSSGRSYVLSTVSLRQETSKTGQRIREIGRMSSSTRLMMNTTFHARS